jgi:diguanylate cyclase (GGDEF)-like protein
MRDFELRWNNGGKELCSHIRMAPEFDASGKVTHVLAVGRDITEIDEYRRKVRQQAYYDSLTSLPNRLLLSERLAGAIGGAACHETQFGLMMLDLDHFKHVNDTLGHSMGDRLLCETAARLSDCVRAGGIVARLGGDEFAILLHELHGGDELVDMASKILVRLAEPFMMEGRELFVTCSIGIARFPSDATEADSLYKYADSAMYHAKKMGRNNFQFYTRDLTQRTVERLEAEAALRKAQKNGELVLYYQPQFDLRQDCLVGAEALLRWQRPGHGLVGPNVFIPLAEESGLILDIGEWVLKTACEAAVRWNRERQEPVKVAVNMSSRQFVRNNLVNLVVRTLLETGCRPDWLELEITESLLLEDSEDVNATLGVFHEMGITISIDDFGTGYSALSYLHRFPVSRLKIDRSFVNGMTEQRDKRELVKAMLSIASALRIESVAEGVETLQQAEYLLARGCRVAQGYLFGKPMPRVEFEALLQEESET